MKKRYVALLTLLVIFLCSLFLYGCKKESIKFYRESAVSRALGEISDNFTQKNQVKKSSGVFIYKDTSYQNNNKTGPVFGPKDINFDLPIRIK